MHKGKYVSVMVAFLVVVIALWATIVAAGWSPQLGLDLQGGVSITLVPAPGQGAVDEEVLDQTVAVIRQRVDALGVAEPDIARQGDTIQVQLPGVADQEQAEDVIGRTAVLQFRRVLQIYPPPDPAYDEVGPDCGTLPEGVPPADEEVVLCEPVSVAEQDEAEGATEDADAGQLPPSQWPKYRLGPVEVDGGEVADARPEVGQFGQWDTALDFTSAGDDAFAELTGELACEQGVLRQLAIVLDGRVTSAPGVQESVICGQGIRGGGVITTGSEEEARELAVVLRTGALPIQLDFATSQRVSATLGSESLQAGLRAGALGLMLVALYLIALYRGLGVLAVLELVWFGVLVYGVIILLSNTVGFTLTLAGIAGVIVSIGIAADSSIIYRERYRDERRAGRTIRTAADHAYSKAFATNLTGNTVSFLAAVVLYVLAVGPVRGFAFTLGLSTLIDTLLFATFTRSAFSVVARSPKLANRRWMGMVGTGDPVTGVAGGSRTARTRTGSNA